MAVRGSSAKARKDDVLTAVCAPGIGSREGLPFRVNCCIFMTIYPGFAYKLRARIYAVVPIDQNFVVKVTWKVAYRER